MQKRATLQPPHKHNSRTAPLRGGRYQPHRTRCKLVMTVSFIGISKGYSVNVPKIRWHMK